MTKQTWNQSEAIDLARKLEIIAPSFGCHVALTGGTLYKDGERKDCDILFYRIRQVDEVDKDGLLGAIESLLGMKDTQDYGWCCKGKIDGKSIDMFFPDDDGEYEE